MPTQDPKSGMLDPEARILDQGSWTQGSGYRSQDLGSMSDAVSRAPHLDRENHKQRTVAYLSMLTYTMTFCQRFAFSSNDLGNWAKVKYAPLSCEVEAF